MEYVSLLTFFFHLIHAAYHGIYSIKIQETVYSCRPMKVGTKCELIYMFIIISVQTTREHTIYTVEGPVYEM